jgi:hypothetical protein
MIRLAADEDLDNDIIRALRRRLPDVDVVRVQDAGLTGCDDRDVLEWAASGGRVLLTHDVSTMTRHALDRVRDGLEMPGVIATPQQCSIGSVLDDLVLIVTCGTPEDLSARLLYLPLR